MRNVQKTKTQMGQVTAKYRTPGQKQSLGFVSFCKTVANRSVNNPLGKDFDYHFVKNFENFFGKLSDTLKKCLAFSLTILHKKFSKMLSVASCFLSHPRP